MSYPRERDDGGAGGAPSYRDRLTTLETRMKYLEQAQENDRGTHNKHIHDLREVDRSQELRIRATEKYIWMGLGGLAILQVVLNIGMALTLKLLK